MKFFSYRAESCKRHHERSCCYCPVSYSTKGKDHRKSQIQATASEIDPSEAVASILPRPWQKHAVVNVQWENSANVVL